MVENKHSCFPFKFACSFPLVSNAAESDNLSEDELPLDEDIPLAGHKEQDKEEDEEAIGGFLGRN